MRAIGVVIPSAGFGDSIEHISKACDEYGRAKAIEDLKQGKVSTLDSLQRDIDDCTERMDRRRQLLQGIMLTVGLVGIYYASSWLLKQR